MALIRGKLANGPVQMIDLCAASCLRSRLFTILFVTVCLHRIDLPIYLQTGIFCQLKTIHETPMDHLSKRTLIVYHIFAAFKAFQVLI